MDDLKTGQPSEIDVSLKDKSYDRFSGLIEDNTSPLCELKEVQVEETTPGKVNSNEGKRKRTKFLEMLVSDDNADAGSNMSYKHSSDDEINPDIRLDDFELIPKLELSSSTCQLCFCDSDHPVRLPCLHTFCEICLREYQSVNHIPERNLTCPMCFTSNRRAPTYQRPETQTMLSPVISEKEEQNESEIEAKDIPHEEYSKSNKGHRVRAACQNQFYPERTNTTHVCSVPLEGRKSGQKNIPMHINMAEQCETHGSVLEFVCLDHQSLACKKCVKKDHRLCSNVDSVSETARRLDHNQDMKKLVKVLRSGKSAMEILVKDLHSQKYTLSNDKASGLIRISEMRRDMNRRLDALQAELEQELDDQYEVEDNRIKSSLKEIEPLADNISSCLEICESLGKSDTPLQLVAAYLYGRCEVESCKDSTNHLFKTYSTSQIDVKIEEHIEAMKMITKFGDVFVHRKPRELPMEIQTWPSFTMRNAEEILEFNLQTKDDRKCCEIQGVAFLKEGTLVVTDLRNNSLKFFGKKGKLLGKVIFNDPPFDVCEMKPGKIAVTRPGSQTISILEFTVASSITVTSNVEKKIGVACYGITFLNGNLIFTSGTSRPHQIYKLQNERRPEVLYEHCYPIFHLTKDERHKLLIASVSSRHSNDASVLQILISGGKAILARNEIAKGARGVGVDIEGNTYICGYRSSNIVQISSDREHIRQLLSCTDGIKNPVALAVREDHLVIFEECSNKGRLFQLSL